MTSQQILQSDLLDILFERRNKEYGAYALRRLYHLQLAKAVGLTAALVLALLFFAGPSAKPEPPTVYKKDIVLSDLAAPPQKVEPPKPKPPAAQPPVKTDVLLDKMKLVNEAKTPVATQRSLDDALPGAARIDAPAAVDPPPSAPPASSTDGGAGEPEPEKKDPPLPSRQPQFPGGTPAWLHFLGRYLTPPADLEPGEKRSVLVRFSVDEEGVVTNFSVVQSGGADFDNEVIRVLKRMPRWLPAIQNGKAVAVSFTQPVTFQAD